MSEDPLVGRNQDYLRNVQYRDPGKLAARADLHSKYAYVDQLRCTSPDDVVAFLTSAPPGEDASPGQLRELRDAVERRFAAGGGVFTISKETGTFLAQGPRRADPPA